MEEAAPDSDSQKSVPYYIYSTKSIERGLLRSRYSNSRKTVTGKGPVLTEMAISTMSFGSSSWIVLFIAACLRSTSWRPSQGIHKCQKRPSIVVKET